MTERDGPPIEEGLPDDLEPIPEGTDVPATYPVPEPEEDEPIDDP